MHDDRIPQQSVIEIRMFPAAVPDLDPIDHAASDISAAISDLLVAAHSTTDADRLCVIYRRMRELSAEMLAAVDAVGQWSDACLAADLPWGV